MFEGIIKVIEKTVELLNLKQKNDVEFFEAVITPLFEEFEMVAKKYFELFRSRRSDFDLSDLRNDYLQSRIKVSELAKIYSAKVEDEDVLYFFKAINKFFFGCHVVRWQPKRSLGASYIDLITNKIEIPDMELMVDKQMRYKIEERNDAIMEMEKYLELNWQRVVSAYGVLKCKYYSAGFF